MKLTVRTTLLSVLAAISMSLSAAENGKTVDGSLERRISDLEKRVSELEIARNVTPSRTIRISNSGNWKDLQNWRQLRTGMSYDEVRALLGEPENIEGGEIASWYWGGRNSHAVFMSDKLYRWSEPR